jgi:hypothetical protein
MFSAIEPPHRRSSWRTPAIRDRWLSQRVIEPAIREVTEVDGLASAFNAT